MPLNPFQARELLAAIDSLSRPEMAASFLTMANREHGVTESDTASDAAIVAGTMAKATHDRTRPHLFEDREVGVLIQVCRSRGILFDRAIENEPAVQRVDNGGMWLDLAAVSRKAEQYQSSSRAVG